MAPKKGPGAPLIGDHTAADESIFRDFRKAMMLGTIFDVGVCVLTLLSFGLVWFAVVALCLFLTLLARQYMVSSKYEDNQPNRWYEWVLLMFPILMMVACPVMGTRGKTGNESFLF